MPYNYKHSHRIAEILGILFFFLYLSLSFREIYFFILLNEINFIIIIFSFFVALLISDFVSGLMHFIGDTFGTEQTRFFGQTFIKPFRDHHIEPEKMAHHDSIELIGNSSIAALSLVIPFYYLFNSQSSIIFFYIFCTLSSFFFFVVITNFFHKWAHEAEQNRIISFLQKYQIILSPEVHNVHHNAPYDKYFCMTNGWLNPILNKLQFFQKIEKRFKK